MADTPVVQKGEDFRSAGDVTVAPNVTASAGAQGFRPGGTVQYRDVQPSTDLIGNPATTTTSVTATAVIGKPPEVAAYQTKKADYDLGGGNSLRVQSGAGMSFRYGSTDEVTIGVRGDLVRDKGQGLSPYFSALASADPKNMQSPSVRLEAGACIRPPDLGGMSSPTVCVGAYSDSSGKKGMRTSTGFDF